MSTSVSLSGWSLFAGFPPPVPPATPEPSDSDFQIRRYTPRKRRGFDWEGFASLVGVLVLLGVGGLLVGMFVNQSTLDLLVGTKKREPQVIEQPQRLQVPEGGGTESKSSGENPQSKDNAKKSKDQVQVQPTVADRHLRESLESLRKGHFDEADLSAEKALRANPGDVRAEGMRLVVAYLQQYPVLADQALDSLNPNDTEIDLGGRNGKAAFVERNGDVLTLRLPGGNKPFSVDEINGMPGARFRITKAFLERNGSPANHLILGARIFVTQQDERGRVDPKRSCDLAETQWRKAASSDDATCVEHANLMLNVLDIE
jgi:hypothetical protein